jgi:hypothetical protein
MVGCVAKAAAVCVLVDPVLPDGRATGGRSFFFPSFLLFFGFWFGVSVDEGGGWF